MSRQQLDRLQAAVAVRVEEKSGAFWQRYLRGNATFRGVPMAGVRDAVHALA